MPLFWLSLAFLTGILLAANSSFPVLGWIAFALASILFLLPPFYRRWIRLVPPGLLQLTQGVKITGLFLLPLMLLFISLGSVRYLLSQPVFNPSFIAYYNDQPLEVTLEGVLVDPPDMRDSYTNLRVRIDKLRLSGTNTNTAVQGLLLARIPSGITLQYGDRIALQGLLKTPPADEEFSYRDYLAHQGIYSYMSSGDITLIGAGYGNPLLSALYKFRQHAMDLVYQLFPDPEASLTAGILLGVETGISPAVQEAFRLTGTSHIIVISGFNISIIAGLFTFLFTRLLGRYKGAIVAAVGIIIYTLLVGANAAVIRAAVLGVITLLGHQVGKRQAGLNSLAFVAGIMALITPSVLWDVSFQLSFAATLGIMLYAQPLTEWFIRTISRVLPQDKAEKLAGPVGAYFLLTLAAQLTTLPVMVYYFKRFSLTALLANPLILPAQPPLMLLGGLSVLTGLLFKPLGQLFAWIAWPFTAYTIRVVEWLARIPHGSIPLGHVSLYLVVLFYLLMFALTFFKSSLTALSARITPAVPLTLLFAATFLIWKSAFYAPDGMLHVTILDVGTGDAVLIQSPTGRSVLINGGPSTLKLSDALGRRMPPFNRSPDWLVIADNDDEDIAGIPSNLERFTPINVLWVGTNSGTHASTDLQAQLIALAIPITQIEPGQSLDLGSGAFLKVISAGPKGAVLLLEWGNFRFLLPMGMDFSSLESLQNSSTMRSVSAVLLPESGYAPLNPPDLFATLHPQLALLSVASADRSGLPPPETIQSLHGYNLLRTDQNGWIELTTDGEMLWVEVERK